MDLKSQFSTVKCHNKGKFNLDRHRYRTVRKKIQ